MSTNLHPDIVKRLAETSKDKSETEKADQRAVEHQGRPDTGPDETPEDDLAHSAEQNDAAAKGRKD